MSLTNPPAALLTDVFGTVVDWRSSVEKYLARTAADTLNNPSRSLASTTRESVAKVSWPLFAQQWRTTYYTFTRGYDPSQGGFKNVDQHQIESLTALLAQHNLSDLWTEAEIRQIAMIWHFLEPWPDSAHGLGLLNQRFETCTLSNGNTALLSDLARHARLPYKHIISAEDFKAYKPHPNVYNGAATRLGLPNTKCALVAAHLNDLEAARGQGFQTIYIERAQEEQWDPDRVEKCREWVDMWIGLDQGGFDEIARRFGCTEFSPGLLGREDETG